MDWIESGSFWLDCPSFADEFVGCQTLQGFALATEVVRGDEVAQVPLQLLMIVIMEAFDGGVLDFRGSFTFYRCRQNLKCPENSCYAALDAGVSVKKAYIADAESVCRSFMTMSPSRRTRAMRDRALR